MKLLRDLRLMSHEKVSVGTVEVTPVDILAALFDKYLSKDVRDITVLYVKARRESSRIDYLVVNEYDPMTRLTSMERTTCFT